MKEEKYQKIWELALPYLKKGIMKDFVIHTNYVVKSMEMIIAGEGGDKDILIPSAILHDVGWSKVDPSLQTNVDLEQKRIAQRQHLVLAKDIIEEILSKVRYEKVDINRVIAIVEAHKFQDPGEKEKQMLIDADNLSDTFIESFKADVVTYKSTPEQVFEYRTQNQYYSKTAKEIAAKNMVELAKLVKNKIDDL